MQVVQITADAAGTADRLSHGRTRGLRPDQGRLGALPGLIRQYVDLRLGLVDASVVAGAERLGVTTVATLNRRDFTVVRPAHCEALTLIP